MKNIYIALTLSIGFLFSSCGKTRSTTTELTLNENPFQLIEKGDLTFTSTDAKGSGKFIYKKKNKKSDNSFTFSLKLPEENASVTLIANADKDLNNGASVTFKRSAEKLKVQLIVSGETHDLSSDFDDVDISKDKVSFVIDIHDETPAHIIIWEKNESDHYEDREAKYNSSKEKRITKKASGKYWGFKLEKASLISPEKGEPKHHHHHN